MATKEKTAGTASPLIIPNVPLETSYQHNREVIEFDIAEMTLPDVPEKDVLAEVLVRGLTEGAGTGNGTTAVVKPVASDAPLWSVGHGAFCARAD